MFNATITEISSPTYQKKGLLYMINLQQHSIRSLVAVMLVFFLLPFNIALLYITSVSSNVFSQSVIDSEMNILNISCIQLEDEMSQIEAFITQGFSSNPNLITASYTNDIVTAKTALMSWLASFNARMLNLNFKPYAYAYNIENASLVTSYMDPIPGAASHNDLLNLMGSSYVEDLSESWDFIYVSGARYLARCYIHRNLFLGALIPVQDVISSTRENFSFKSPYCNLTFGADIPSVRTGRILLKRQLKGSPIFLWVSMESSEIAAKIPQVQNVLLIISVLFTILLPLMFILANRYIIRPLNRIDQALNKINDGDTEYRISAHNYAREFVHINSSFNHMVDSVVNLKMKNYESRLQIQQHEMLNLQLQIKPHFLYNTFNDISSLAALHDYRGIQKMMRSMSDYFRYSVRTGYHMVPLERELNFLHAYLSIMEMRFYGCFTFRSNVEVGIEKVLIPPLLIHTFVENIMTHIVKVGTYTTITLNARRNEGYVVLEIIDDGEGMDEETVRRLNDKKKLVDEFGKEHIGIWNCFKRLIYFYEGNAEMKIYSTPLEGTRILITIPFSTEDPKSIKERYPLISKR